MASSKGKKHATSPLRATGSTRTTKRAAAPRAKSAGPKRRTIKRIDASPAFMEQERVARYGKLRSSAKAFIDTRFPNGAREILNVIGRGVVEDAELLPPITDNQDFNVAFIRARHGKGATLHIHETLEVFIPIKGEWGIYWQNKDGTKHEVVLNPCDTVSVPVGLSRGFRYVGKGVGLMLAIIGGTDPGRVRWPKETIEMAKKLGYVLKDGDLIELSSAAE